MADIIVVKKNESFIHIDCEIGILYELKEHFTFFVDGYKHMAKYKNKMWDGTISLIDLRFATLPVGLYHDMVDFATELGYEVQCYSNIYGSPDDKEAVTLEEITEFCDSLNIHSDGKLLPIRDYQYEAIYNCIYNQRQISLTPTGGGKSLIAYCIYRWHLSRGRNGFLLIVTTLGLMKQMYSDFKDYSSHNRFDIVGTTQVIGDGTTKVVSKNLVISTWQSIYTMPSKWLNENFDVMLGDEIHQYKADCIKGIFEKATNVKFRVGITGSLDKVLSNKMVLRGMIGEVSRVKTTRDLIDAGYLSDIKINALILKYNKESKKLIKDSPYQTEIKFICQHKRRNEFIAKLALKQKGNTLVLFNFVEDHGEPLYEKIKEYSTTQKVHLVCGKVEADDREHIRKVVQESTEDNIIVASVGTFSTGINLPRIHTIIFAMPTKSVIRVLQSIGRGLRKSDDKEYLTLYDICDSIVPSKTKPNHTFKHFAERLRIYTDEKLNYNIMEMNIE